MGTGPAQIAILIASERKMESELISRALNSRAGFRVVACVPSVAEVLKAVQPNTVNIALISASLKDGPLSGIRALQSIQEISPGVKGVILIEPSEAHLVVPVFRAGARGVFCPAGDGIEKLCRCVERVHAGQIWANSAELLQVLQAFSQAAPARLISADGTPLLTKREEEIVHLVEQAYTNREIAQGLHLSEHTIRNNLFRIFDKLGVSTRVELALYAATSTKRVFPAAADNNNAGLKTNTPILELDSAVQ